MRREAAVITAVLWFALSAHASGDGLRMKDGRYSGGPVTILELSRDQRTMVRTKRVVVLTPEQKRKLGRDTGLRPSVLTVYSLKAVGQNCTCFAYNVAIWFEAGRIEVPHQFLLNDRDAQRRQDEIESIE